MSINSCSAATAIFVNVETVQSPSQLFVRVAGRKKKKMRAFTLKVTTGHFKSSRTVACYDKWLAPAVLQRSKNTQTKPVARRELSKRMVLLLNL